MMNPSFIDNEFSFSKVQFQQDIFLKLFFNFHKNHKLPLNLLPSNRSYGYFSDRNSKIEDFRKVKSKKIESVSKQTNMEAILKSINEINQLSPENNKKLKTQKLNKSPQKFETPKRIFKKVENFHIKPSSKIDDNMFQKSGFDKDIQEKQETTKMQFKMYVDSSLSRLKLLGLEEILEEIKELEKNKVFSEQFI